MRAILTIIIAVLSCCLSTVVAGQPTTLLIASIDNEDMHRLRSLSPHFEREHPDIRLQWLMLSERELRQRLLVDIAAGDTPFDLMTAGAYEVALLAKMGRLAPVGILPPDYDAADLVDAVRRSLTVDGRLHALPFYAEGVLTYFRADLLRAKGLSMPAHPRWDDLVRLAAALHDPAAGVSGICLRGRPGWGGNVTLVSALASARGARWLDERQHPRLDTPLWKSSVAQFAGLLRQYGPRDALARGFLGNLQLFADGHCGIWVDASVAGSALTGKMKAPAELGVAPAPLAENGRAIAWTWVWALAVPRGSRHAAAAMRFAAWATSRHYIGLVAREHGWIAVPPGTRKSTYTDPAYRAAAPFAALALAAVRDQPPAGQGGDAGTQFVAIPEFLPIGTLVGQAIAAVMEGKMSPDTAMELAQLRAEQVLRQSGRTR